jgi:hypothetical protein
MTSKIYSFRDAGFKAKKLSKKLDFFLDLDLSQVKSFKSPDQKRCHDKTV